MEISVMQNYAIRTSLIIFYKHMMIRNYIYLEFYYNKTISSKVNYYLNLRLNSLLTFNCNVFIYGEMTVITFWKWMKQRKQLQYPKQVSFVFQVILRGCEYQCVLSVTVFISAACYLPPCFCTNNRKTVSPHYHISVSVFGERELL